MEHAIAPPRTRDRCVVLLVEDSRAHAELIEDMLDEVHPELELVHRSRLAAAEELVREQPPDCVLMDLGLPDADGLAGVLRLTRAAPAVPIVVLTGRDDDEVAAEAVHRGAQDFLVKSRSDGYVIGRAVRHAIERKRAQLELTRHAAEVQAFAEFQRDFIAAASHELRTPLTSILGYVELLVEDPDADVEERRSHARAAHRNCHRLLELVEDLLSVNRIETGTVPVALRPVALGELVDGVAEQAGVLAGRRGLTLELRPGLAGALEVAADPARTIEVLGNLVSNAVKFTPPGGTVRIGCGIDGDRGTISVSDTGVGIPAAELPRIFDRFYRSSSSVRMATPGTGLGLTIAASLVEAQGGTLTVRSEAGEGSTFTVLLPLAAGER